MMGDAPLRKTSEKRVLTSFAASLIKVFLSSNPGIVGSCGTFSPALPARSTAIFTCRSVG